MGVLTFVKDELAVEIGMERTTVNRLVTDDPDRLPPFINLGTPRRIKPVWLKETVRSWLKQREGSSQVLEITVKKPARGRPRKVAVLGV